MHDTRKTHERGFTLIELMVVVVIMGLLLGIVVPKFIGSAERSARAAAKAQLAHIGGAVEMYQLHKLRLPEQLAVLTELDETGNSFIPIIPLDPWDGEFEYSKVSRKQYELRCLGPDGEANSEDDLVHPIYLRER